MQTGMVLFNVGNVLANDVEVILTVLHDHANIVHNEIINCLVQPLYGPEPFNRWLKVHLVIFKDY